jgi:hypothetical protein
MDQIAAELENLLNKREELRTAIKAAEGEHVPGPETQTLLVEWKNELTLVERQISDLETRVGS